MKIQTVIDLAKAGELQQLAIKDDINVVVGILNLGLIELYKRFPLRTEEYLIELQEGVTIYDMPEDFMYITGAYEEVPEGADFATLACAINEEDNPLSINTISYNQIQVPLSSAGSYISILYVPSPVPITVDNLLGSLPIPDQLVDPLMHYIGYRGHGSINGNIQTEGNTHYMRFEASCNKVKTLGIGVTADGFDMSMRVATRGFV